eukprot:GILI01012925.1.p1 GENE.GILI01012925.1~~GILI01012925.1.p1  ORF type:complete len:135 (+),score=29.70 GILI01012925.1:36-407(+)
MSNFLIVNFTFNSPVIRIIGPVREQTVEKLNSVIAQRTTSLRSSRAGQPKFEHKENPSHWVVHLDGQYCDQVGMSQLFLSVCDALEEEGGWKLASTQSATMKNEDSSQQDHMEAYKFFFVRIQ